jgi:hypothetical protein
MKQGVAMLFFSSASPSLPTNSNPVPHIGHSPQRVRWDILLSGALVAYLQWGYVITAIGKLHMPGLPNASMIMKYLELLRAWQMIQTLNLPFQLKSQGDYHHISLFPNAIPGSFQIH